MRLTLSQLIPAVAQTLNLNSSGAAGSKVIDYINRAQEELLNMGRFVGTTIKYKICSASGFITWPREIQTIEAMQINGAPATLQNQWYQFLDYGADYRPYYSGGAWGNGFRNYRSFGTGIDEREAISFDDVCVCENAKKLKVYGTATEAAGARILLQFYDGQGNYVRTNDATEGWVDGEFVAINSTTPQTTVNAVTAWVGVQKPITNGVVRITELDTVTNLERLLAVYAPDETNPSYRRTYLPGFCWNGGPNPARSITVLGSQRFIPALNPRDYLCLASKPAIIWKAKAVYLADNNNVQESAIYDAKAFACLNDELNKWTGGGNIQTPRFNAAKACEIGEQNFV